MRRRATNIRVMLAAPLIVATIVISGTFLGLYLADFLGISRALSAGAMATIGLVISMILVVKFVDAMVKKETSAERTEQKRA